MSSRTRGDTNKTVAAAAAAAAGLANSIEGKGEEGSEEVAVLSPPRYRKNRGTSDNEVHLMENDFCNLSPALATTPQKGQNKKKSKPMIEFRVGDKIDYWAPGSIVGIHSNLRNGMITQIYSSTDWDDSDDMYECHLVVGTDAITYGSQIRPINTEKWIVTSSDSCKFIKGVLKGGSSASVGNLSDQFKRIDEAARTSFQYSPSGSDFSGDGAGDHDHDSLEPEKLGTPTSTATSSPQFSPPQFSLQGEDEGEVQSFYNDQSKLPTGSKMVTLMVLAVGVVVDFMTTVVGDETTFTPPHPYSNFIAGKCPGFGKTKFTVTKKILAAEILRRSPNEKVKNKNTGLSTLWQMLAKYPITDQRDKDFIINEEKKLRTILLAKIAEDGGVVGPGRVTEIDKLRFIIILISPTVKAAYLRSQIVKDRHELDCSNSDKREVHWTEIMVEMFNDEDMDVATQSYKHLHDDFHSPIECMKGSYTLTIDKAKELIMSMKHKLREIIRRYNASGNGSDMRIDNVDIDGDELEAMREGGVNEMSEDNYGRFNRVTSLRRAVKMGDQELILKDGDDRKSFLQHEATTLLYWWHVMDEHNLLWRTCAMLSDDQSASSSRKPKPVSRHERKLASNASTSKGDTRDKHTKEMHDNVRRMTEASEKATNQTKITQVERLKDKVYELEWKLLDVDKEDLDRVALIKKRIAEINSSIELLC